MTFEGFLDELGDVKRPLVTTRLARLSSLSPMERNELARYWPRIEAARKERIAKLLVGLAEDNVEMDFTEVFRLCLSDKDASVRVAGIEGLFECEEKWFLNQLVAMARNDEAEKVRAAAAGVEALGRFALLAELGDLSTRNAQAVDEALLDLFNDENEAVEVRRRAIESLGVRITEAAVTAINRAYTDDRQELRIGAIFAMGRSSDERWLNILVQELSSPDSEMRYEAVNACAELEDERVVPYLVPLLQDSDTQVRMSAVSALGQIGGRRAKEELMRCLQHADEHIREAARDALDELTFGENPLSYGVGL